MSLTSAGSAYLADALANGTAVVITEFDVRDDQGVELYRGSVDFIKSDGSQYKIRMTVPSGEGPFSVAALGIYASDGTLIDDRAVARSKIVGSPLLFVVDVTIDAAQSVTVSYDSSATFATFDDVPSDLSDLSDVETSGATADQVLTFDGAAWGAADAQGGGVDSVNGETGAVVLDAGDVGFIDDYAGTGSTDTQGALDSLARSSLLGTSGESINSDSPVAITTAQILGGRIIRITGTAGVTDTTPTQSEVYNAVRGQGVAVSIAGFPSAETYNFYLQSAGNPFDVEWSTLQGTQTVSIPRRSVAKVGITTVTEDTLFGGSGDPGVLNVSPNILLADSRDYPRIVALTAAEYAAITPDSSTLYRTTDTGAVYLGAIQLS